jgi:argonaute-like protein implicated in RNA metabolism and viral defense
MQPSLTGEILPQAALRFDYSSDPARHQQARAGLRLYGPYDGNLQRARTITCQVIFAGSTAREKETRVRGLTQGLGPFPGFQRYFRLPIVVERERQVFGESEPDLRRAAQQAAQDAPDLVFVVTSYKNDQIHATVKAELLGNGLPNQVVTAPNLRDANQTPWVLENLALSSYAKAGGTPWVVATDDRRRELVIGISRAQDKSGNVVVGFVTLFTQDGDFLFMSSLAPKPFGWNRDEYVEGLASLVRDAAAEYEHRQGKPQSIIVHLCKRPGRWREVEALINAVEEIGGNVPYALLHLNDGSNFRLFDTSDPTYVPRSGIAVDLSRRGALLLVECRIPGQQRRLRGVPRVLDISLDSRSTMDSDEFPRLVEQVYRFARVNWRGFNARAVPATLNYSYLIARLVAEIGADRWNGVASAGRLRDKASFL